MVNITIAQYPTNEGVLVRLTLDTAASVIVYARDETTGKIYDLQELLTDQTVHYATLKIPTSYGQTKIVAHAIQ